MTHAPAGTVREAGAPAWLVPVQFTDVSMRTGPDPAERGRRLRVGNMPSVSLGVSAVDLQAVQQDRASLFHDGGLLQVMGQEVNAGVGVG